MDENNIRTDLEQLRDGFSQMNQVTNSIEEIKGFKDVKDYSEYIEKENGIEIKINLTDNEDMKLTIDFFKEEIDSLGRLKIYVDLKNVNFYLQSESDTIYLRVN